MKNTKIHILKEAANRPFECIAIGDYFYHKGELFIRTDNEYDVYGYGVRLSDGRKHRFDNFEEVDLVENITISVN